MREAENAFPFGDFAEAVSRRLHDDDCNRLQIGSEPLQRTFLNSLHRVRQEAVKSSCIGNWTRELPPVENSVEHSRLLLVKNSDFPAARTGMLRM